MEEELLKRSTDCVYFLASPFTCKKGAECEYRHSDMARLNPRDCWYWLSGNCLNPTCAFRHPPLDVHTEESSEATAPLLNNPPMTATKCTVPCYFYFNGFCSKGDKCPFLHEPDDTYAWKPKMVNKTADVPFQPLETKASGRNDTETVSEKNHHGALEMAVKSGNCLQVQQKQQVQQHGAENVRAWSTSAHACTPDLEGTGAVRMVSLQPAEDLPKSEGESESEPSLGPDQSSEELIDGNLVRDDWCESSPGFDVLVDGRTEDMPYEDGVEYLHALNGSDGDREGLSMRHGYADQNDYDESVFYRNGLHDSYELLDGRCRGDHRIYSPRRTLGRKVGCVVSHKRKFLSLEFPVGDYNSVDLRDYLRKRRMGDGWRHDLVCRRDEGWENQRHGANQRLYGRVKSKIERSSVGLSKRRFSVDAHRRGRPRNSQHNRSREHNRMRQRQLSTEGRQRLSLKRERVPPVSITFTGPKSLAEIKGEKRVRQSAGNESVDFDGPKPLGEILKDKKKKTSTVNVDFNDNF